MLIAFCSVVANADKNEMVLLNVATVIGNTLIYSSSRSPSCKSGTQISSSSIDITSDLISSYAWLFDVSREELEKERQINDALEKLGEAKIVIKPAGDILVGVHVYDRDSGICVNVRLTPQMTARDLITSVISLAKLTDSPNDLSVFEIVCNDQLERVLHFSDVVLGVTLSWSTNWPQEDAKQNYLLVKENKQLFGKLLPYLSLPSGSGGLHTSSLLRQSTIPFSLYNELKLSDINCGRNFKKVLFEFAGAKLIAYKDRQASKVIGEWNIEDITWYLGAEKKRYSPTIFSFTFLDRNQNIERKRENGGLIGRVVCCHSEEEYYKWIAGMIITEHPRGLYPPKVQMDLLA